MLLLDRQAWLFSVKTFLAALAALSNLVTNIVGFYAGVFIGLPIARKLYAFWTRVFRRPAAEIKEARFVAQPLVPVGDASVLPRKTSARPTAARHTAGHCTPAGQRAARADGRRAPAVPRYRSGAGVARRRPCHAQ